MSSTQFGMFSLAGRIALVTGAAQGLGFGMATGLAEAGALVVLNDVNAERAEAAKQSLISRGLKAEARLFDVTREPDVEQAVAEIESNIGPIDILINNAGMNLRGPIEEFTLDKWQRLMDLNLNGVFIVAKHVGRRMIARKRGKVINVASLLSERGRPGIAPYTASKGAVKLFTLGLAVEWAKHNIQVNAIGPGYFDTEMNKALVENPDFDRWVKERTPAGRWGRPSDLAGAAVFLASAASDFVTGQVIYVDGGWLAAV